MEIRFDNASNNKNRGFKPNRMRRMKCIPIGDWIECAKMNCEDCDYLECSHR